MKRNIIYKLLFFCLFGVSCVDELADPMEHFNNKENINISFVIDSLATKSSISPSEDKVENYSVFAYNNGSLIIDIYHEGNESFDLSAEKGLTLNFYAVANMGDITPPESESDLADFTYMISNTNSLSSAFPMVASRKSLTVDTENSLVFGLSRLVAKVNFTFDKSQLTDLIVRSVSLKQTPIVLRPFSQEGSKALTVNEVIDGDYATAEDILALNNGELVSFYMLENRQGDLLPSNTDPWNKVPTSINDESELCSYLEVYCEFDPEVCSREGECTYKMYLGENNTSNFDVERNKIVSVTLQATETGLNQSSWKIVSDYIQHVTSVVLDKESVTLGVGDATSLTATVYPSDAHNKTLSWTSSNNSIATVDANGKITAKAIGTCKIRATSNDMPDVYDECTLTVKKSALESISINNPTVNLIVGTTGQTHSFTYTAGFEDGTEESISATSLTYSSNNTSIFVVNSSGVVTAKGKGVGTLTVTYTLNDAYGNSITKSATATINVSQLYINPSSLSLEKGSTGNMYAKIMVYNGSETNASATWSTSNSSVATIPSGNTIRGAGTGTATITAVYSGTYGSGSASGTVSVSNPLKSIVITPESVLLAKTQTQKYTIKGTYADGTTISDASLFTWNSSSTNVATISSAGIATAKNTGNTTITASKDGITSNGATLTVNPTYTYELRISSSTATVNVDKTTQLNAVYYTYTDGVSNGGININSLASWNSVFTDIATVSNGLVTGISKGSTEITVTYLGHSCTCTVTVVNPIKSITLDKTSATIWEGESLQLTATATYTNGAVASASDISWTSSNSSIATVSSGKVLGVYGGSATVTASIEGLSASCSVTVKKNTLVSVRGEYERPSIYVYGSISNSMLQSPQYYDWIPISIYATFADGVERKLLYQSSVPFTHNDGTVDQYSFSTENGAFTIGCNSLNVSGSYFQLYNGEDLGYRVLGYRNSNPNLFYFCYTRYSTSTSNYQQANVNIEIEDKYGNTASNTVVLQGALLRSGASTYTEPTSLSLVVNQTVQLNPVIYFKDPVSGIQYSRNLNEYMNTLGNWYINRNSVYLGNSCVTINADYRTTGKLYVTGASAGNGYIYFGNSTSSVYPKVPYVVSDPGYQIIGIELGGDKTVYVNEEFSLGTNAFSLYPTFTVNYANGESETIQTSYGNEVTQSFSDGIESLIEPIYPTIISGESYSINLNKYPGYQRFKAISKGSFTYTIEYEGFSDSATITIAGKDWNELYVTNSSDVGIGQSGSLSAYYRVYQDSKLTSQTNVTSSTTFALSSSSDANYLTLSGNKYTGKSPSNGTIVIKGTYTNNGTTYTDNTYVEVYDQIVGFSISPSSTNIKVDESFTYTASTTSYLGNTTSVTLSDVSWSSSNSNVATVSKGIVTGVGEGSAVITASYNGYNSTSMVTVASNKVITYKYRLKLLPTSKSINVESSFSFDSITLYKDTYTNGTLTSTDTVGTSLSTTDCTWSSSSTSIATVSSAGIVTGVSNGTVTITAKWKSDTSVTDSISVTVNSSSTDTDWDDEDYEIEL